MFSWAIPQVAQMVKNLPVMQEIWIWSLGREDPPGEGKVNPLQNSCLGNPMDRGAWQAPVHGAEKSQTWLSTHTHRVTQSLKYKWLYWGEDNAFSIWAPDIQLVNIILVWKQTESDSLCAQSDCRDQISIPFTPPFIDPAFIEHLLGAWHSLRLWKHNDE